MQCGSLVYTGIVLFVSVHSLNWYYSPSSHEITIAFVSSLFGYLMYYIQKQTETNMNTNKVIMSKLYGVSCHHPCHHYCCQLLLCWYNVVVVVNGLLLTAGSNQIESNQIKSNQINYGKGQ